MAENKHKVLFLCSGGGGNLAFLHRYASVSQYVNFEICGVVVDRLCGAQRYSQRNGIPVECVRVRTEGQDPLKKALKRFSPDIIVTNVHFIISEDVLCAINAKFINVHYSLLPSFGGSIGTKPVESAMAYGCKFTGVTAHEVTVELDRGSPYTQCAIPLEVNDELGPVMERVFRCGCISLLRTVCLLSAYEDVKSVRGADVYSVGGVDCFFKGGLSLNLDSLSNEAFWCAVKSDLNDPTK